MPLQPGSTVGAYEVVSLLGQGGMGQVYRARDPRLNRDVALKVLPDVFSVDASRVARFEREAQLLASLNHPGIAAIYGVERTDESPVLVLELVEGVTLADRLAAGPLPLDDVLRVAQQMAVALEAAHEKGVVHRDLKPAHIKVTDRGQVKVLDFGLAKMLAPEGDSSALANSPTVSLQGTRAGEILGTAAYMSPEQARGRALDRRTDVWSFGRSRSVARSSWSRTSAAAGTTRSRRSCAPRFRANGSLRISYALSRSYLDGVDFFLTTRGTQRTPNERGYNPADQRHNLTIAGSVSLPWSMALSGLVTLASGSPMKVQAGEDLDGDTTVTGDRPPDIPITVGRERVDESLAAINEYRGTKNLQPIDASLLRLDPYRSLDVRLAKSWRVSRHRLDVLVEVFNVTNHVNSVRRSAVRRTPGRA